jgi:hypothetical protein
MLRRRARPYRHPALYRLAVLAYNVRALIRRTRKVIRAGARWRGYTSQ